MAEPYLGHPLHYAGRQRPHAAKYEAAARKVVTGKEMKALTGIALIVGATFTDLRFTEPALLLLSGGVLLGIAGAVRRLPA